MELEKAIQNQDMQWALQISDRLIALDFQTSKTKKLRATAAQTIAAEAANPNKRNYFLTAALELNPNFQSTTLLPNTKELLNEISMDMFFDILAIRLNPEKIDSSQYRVCFAFSSGLRRTITLRNKVAEVSSINSECNLEIESDDQVFKETLAGLRKPIITVASGAINANGESMAFLKFLGYFTD